MNWPLPPKTECHLVQVDDDPMQTASICSQGDFRFTGTSRNEKMAAAYQHLADVLGRT